MSRGGCGGCYSRDYRDPGHSVLGAAHPRIKTSPKETQRPVSCQPGRDWWVPGRAVEAAAPIAADRARRCMSSNKDEPKGDAAPRLTPAGQGLVGPREGGAGGCPVALPPAVLREQPERCPGADTRYR